MISKDNSQAAEPTRDDIAARAPIGIGGVTLIVRDLDHMTRFYREVVGLEPIAQEGATFHLGVYGRILISLRHDPNALPNSPRSAGLYHIAFLLPSRGDLGAWVRHVLQLRVRLTGASDHLVSEAIYLTDPEGNGVEVYADRPSSTWTRIQQVIQMGAGPLDLGELSRSTTLDWNGMPEGGTVGHVHLQVGDVATADSFYGALLGFKINAAAPTVSFYSTGGYHHQLAVNTWQSAGAGIRREGTAGLAEVELLLRDSETLATVTTHLADAGKLSLDEKGHLVIFDPWNIRLRLTSAATARRAR
ncbi:VOC family protein [Agrobacterium sp. ICMP 7243]|nr:VOC family protein [Agrobacterium sp. ICMP 7243]NTG17141.1 VOC family protein [Rhizobium rhizogenes]NTG31947.1 VOC family protein [Rhizobium rhizogenes]NTI91486.1 VOC family protein [Rhizobium rhizogenes]